MDTKPTGSPQQSTQGIPLDEAIDSYRQHHGGSTLTLSCYMGRGDQFVLASKSEHEVVLVTLKTHRELVLTHEEFTSEFFIFFTDDTVYYFGSEEDKMSANKDMEAYSAAVQYCVGRSTTASPVNVSTNLFKGDQNHD